MYELQALVIAEQTYGNSLIPRGVNTLLEFFIASL